MKSFSIRFLKYPTFFIEYTLKNTRAIINSESTLWQEIQKNNLELYYNASTQLLLLPLIKQIILSGKPLALLNIRNKEPLIYLICREILENDNTLYLIYKK
jgi:hypothetical protein